MSPVPTEGLSAVAGTIPMPVALAVVGYGPRVLMVWERAAWELPGGPIAEGESPHDAAYRVLESGTGVCPDDLACLGVAELERAVPARREYAAVFGRALCQRPKVQATERAHDVMWWDPASPLPHGMSPLDAEIARRCYRDLPD